MKNIKKKLLILIYHLNLMGHKILNRLKKNLLSHLREFYKYIKDILEPIHDK